MTSIQIIITKKMVWKFNANIQANSILKLIKCVDIKKHQAKGQIKSFKDMNTILCTNIICEFFFSMFKGKKFKASLPTSIALKYYNRL
jgi:hypothetical protein